MAKKTAGYVGWEEVVVSGEKGRREVHYYLRDARGGLDLAVVGRERSARHMSYAVPARFFRSCGADAVARLPPVQQQQQQQPSLSSSPSWSGASTVTSGGTTPSWCSSPSPPPLSSSSWAGASLALKWRSRREVIDWISSIVSGPSLCSTPVDELLHDKDVDIVEGYALKGISSEQMRLHSKEFLWLGSAWTCRKQWKHYSSFCRYGITISVHDFVYVMSEENKRLVAYVEDLYEDLKARKKVVVRWFHKIDEVNIILPPDVNDREIFFSLCLQDLSVECIDGLAAVLSAQHFEKYLNESVQSPWRPFLGCRQIDNEDVKPFDITHLRGYWKQELIKCMFMYPKLHLKSTAGSMSTSADDANDSIPNHKPKRKNRLMTAENAKGSLRLKFRRVGDPSVSGRHSSDCFTPAPLPPKKSPNQKIQQPLFTGCHVEVLSQDSGLRGCWFRCVVLKRHQNKVKVRYQDLRDADETGYLEEWILASKVAAVDKLGIRLQGRTILRPQPLPRSKTSPVFDLGSVVDAWWHDGWWEGIVISKEADNGIRVYFPGEQRASVFGLRELRQSQDWSCSGWNNIGDRPDLASLLLSDSVREKNGKDSEGCTTSQEHRPLEIESPTACTASDDKFAFKMRCGEVVPAGRGREAAPEPALDDLLSGLKWRSSRKRRPRGLSRSSNPNRRREKDGSQSGVSLDSVEDSSPCMKFLVPQPLMADNNCKYRGDPFFSDSTTAISNLVASR